MVPADEFPLRPLTLEEAARRRKRSVAIALALAALAIVFFVTTIVRLGGNVAERTF